MYASLKERGGGSEDGQKRLDDRPTSHPDGHAQHSEAQVRHHVWRSYPKAAYFLQEEGRSQCCLDLQVSWDHMAQQSDACGGAQQGRGLNSRGASVHLQH